MYALIFKVFYCKYNFKFKFFGHHKKYGNCGMVSQGNLTNLVDSKLNSKLKTKNDDE